MITLLMPATFYLHDRGEPDFVFACCRHNGRDTKALCRQKNDPAVDLQDGVRPGNPT